MKIIPRTADGRFIAAASIALLVGAVAAQVFGLGRLGEILGRLGRGGAPSIQSCAQATAFLARTSGFSEADKNAYTRTICGLVTSGTFAKLDALYILAAPNHAASLLNLVQNNYNPTRTGGMIFGPGAGWMGDAATGALNTGFTPSTAGGHYALGSASMGIGVGNPRQSPQTWVNIGTIRSDRSVMDAIALLDGSHGNSNTILEGNVTPLSDSSGTAVNGFWAFSRVGATLTFYCNGIGIGTTTNTATGLPDIPIFIGALNLPANLGGPTAFTGDSLTYAFFGSGLTQADITALYQALSSFPVSQVPVPAAARGFGSHAFEYDFAASGLGGIDVDGTFAPGFALYSTWQGGAQSPRIGNARGAPASAYSYDGTRVAVGNAATSALLSTAADTSAAFEATISGTIMTVSSVLYGPLLARQALIGNAALSGQTIVRQLAGTSGGVGTYEISAAATIASAARLIGFSSVGATFAAGGYFEATMSYDQSNDKGSNGMPGFWLLSRSGFGLGNLNHGYGAAGEFAEFDIIEAKSGAMAAAATVHDWTGVNGGPARRNSVSQIYPSLTNPTAKHRFGMLWVPSTQNGGTGLIQFYLDGTRLTGFDITYSAGAGSSPAGSPSNPHGNLIIAERKNDYAVLIQGGASPYNGNLYKIDVWR